MVEAVDRYVDTVWPLPDSNELMVEQCVDFSHIVGVENSFGTADAVIIVGNELQIHDLKYGRGVQVDAEQNEQLQLYTLGALEQFGCCTISRRYVCLSINRALTTFQNGR